MGRKRKRANVQPDIRLAAFEKQCEMIAEAVKLIHANLNELLAADEVAKMCGMSKSSFLRLSDSGMAPASIKLERLRRWRRQEVLAWISAGCPNKARRSKTNQPAVRSASADSGSAEK